MKKVFIETYGCPSNTANAEIIVGLLKENGFGLTNSPNESDLIIINTCVVKIQSEQRMVFRIKELAKLEKPIIVTGCMAKARIEKN
jgi:tRNA A37 methylthiotransferase MiaB